MRRRVHLAAKAAAHSAKQQDRAIVQDASPLRRVLREHFKKYKQSLVESKPKEKVA